MIEPPTKQWALVELALADYDKISKTPGYCINMGTWHIPGSHINKGPECYVCLAGCVMAGTLKVSKDTACSPESFDKSWSKCLYELDYHREGSYRGKRGQWCDYAITHHFEDPIKWREDMGRYVEFLKENDL